MPQRLLVQALLETGVADALAEEFVEGVHACIVHYLTRIFHSRQHYVGESGRGMLL